MKLIRRQESQDEDQLYNAIMNTTVAITPEDCNVWFRHMESYIPKCLNKQVIQN